MLKNTKIGCLCLRGGFVNIARNIKKSGIVIICIALLFTFKFPSNKAYALSYAQVVQSVYFSTDKVVSGNTLSVTLTTSSKVFFSFLA